MAEIGTNSDQLGLIIGDFKETRSELASGILGPVSGPLVI